MLGVCVDQSLDITFGNKSSIEPINIFKRLSQTYQYISGHDVPDPLNLHFQVDDLSQYSDQQALGFIAEIIWLRSLLYLVPQPDINR